MLHPVTLTLKNNQMAMIGEPVNHGRRHLIIRENCPPFLELRIRRNNKTPSFITVGNDSK
jgi:hypothetical protein